MGQGSSVMHIYTHNLRRLQLLVPPLPEQRKIAAILSSVDDAIRATEAVIEQTRRVKQGLLQELLTKGIGHSRFKQTSIGAVPEEWEVVSVANLAVHVTSGPRGWARHYSDNGALFVRSQNIRDGQLDLTDQARVKPPPGLEAERSKLEPHDVLITITGNSVGNVCCLPDLCGDAYASQHVGIVRLGDTETAGFVASYLSPSGPGNRRLMQDSYGQSKPGLNLAQLGRLLVPMPPTHERNQIEQAVSSVTRWCQDTELVLRRQQSVKSGLLQDLLTGKVRVQP